MLACDTSAIIKLAREFYDRFGDRVMVELVTLLTNVDAAFRADAGRERSLTLLDSRVQQRLADAKAEPIKWIIEPSSTLSGRPA